jgi:hypothetical protein
MDSFYIEVEVAIECLTISNSLVAALRSEIDGVVVKLRHMLPLRGVTGHCLYMEGILIVQWSNARACTRSAGGSYSAHIID